MKPTLTSHLRVALPAVWLLAALPATAANFSGLWVVGATVPDNSIIGLTDTRTVTSDITSISSVIVTLNIDGGWAGDLYAYVVHGTGFSVLLNRPGRSDADLHGIPAAGLHVAFDDTAATDVHLAPPGAAPLTGTFQPDGRSANPVTVTNLSPRNAMLNSFNGLPAAGTWSLFIADVAAGDEAVLQSWSMEITGVPEPSTSVFCLAATASLLLRRRGRSGN